MSQMPGNPLPPPLTQSNYAPIYMPAPQSYAPRGGGFARAIFTTLAVSILGFSLSLNIYLLIAHGVLSGDSDVHKTVLATGDAKNVVAVIPIEGTILEPTYTTFDAMLKSIEADKSIKAIVLEIDSPGGSVTASDEIYQRIIEFKKERNIPIVASMGALATSGGYYISCAADYIVAQRTTWTGNIGVLLPRYNLAEFGQKYGIKENTLHSTGADFKDAGSMFKEDTPAQTAYWQGLIDEAFVVFKDVVQQGRKLNAATVDRIANGKVYSGTEALRLKLVDQVGNFKDATEFAESHAGIGVGQSQVVRYEPQKSFFDSLGARSALRSTFASASNGSMGVNIDRDVIDAFTTPRPMYMWQGR